MGRDRGPDPRGPPGTHGVLIRYTAREQSVASSIWEGLTSHGPQVAAHELHLVPSESSLSKGLEGMERQQPPGAASVGPTASTPDPVNALSSLVARGSIALLARQVIAFSCLFLSGIGLARTLGPSDLGLLTIALLVTRIGAVLVDGGLGAALVRQSSPPSAAELQGTFTAQLLVALATSSIFGLLGLVAWLESPNWFAPSAYFACTIAVLAMAGVSVPLAVLERDMKFGRLGLVTLVQPLTFATGVAMVVAFDAGLVAVSLAVAASYWLQVPVAALLAGHTPRVARIDPGLRGRLQVRRTADG